MKIVYGRRVYDQFSPEDRAKLKPVACDCIKGNDPNIDCDTCLGGGVVYEDELSADVAAGIEENLELLDVRLQGAPLGKDKMH